MTDKSQEQLMKKLVYELKSSQTVLQVRLKIGLNIVNEEIVDTKRLMKYVKASRHRIMLTDRMIDTFVETGEVNYETG